MTLDMSVMQVPVAEDAEAVAAVPVPVAAPVVASVPVVVSAKADR
ncbi:hypothetical protein GCM10010350_60110 [Streptomyces galilaeus]|nr:hypothetical protein GCM10010350_60110 [Streptomyces galilaeus]